MSILGDLDPFNIDLMLVDNEFIRKFNLSPITSLNITDNSTSSFSEDGLFSNEIFGMVGSKERIKQMAYIPLNTGVMHPELFRNIISLKSLYKDIFAGKEYGIIKDGDIVKSNIIDGETGYKFMVDSLLKLKLEDRGSPKRKFIIKLLDKYKDVLVSTTGLLVLPAGLRDYEVDKNGKPSEHEVNPLYRKVMNSSNLIDKDVARSDIKAIDKLRYSLQSGIHELYMYYLDFLDGKRGFVYSKFVRRNTFNTTRNVLSSTSIKINKLGDPNNVSSNDTIKGLFQTAVDLLPILVYSLGSGIVGRAIPTIELPASLVNVDTLKLESVELTSNEYNSWLSIDGISKLLAKFKQEELRHKPVMVAGHYLSLLYKGKDMTYRVVHNIDNVPEHIDRSLIKPITMAELLYISLYKLSKKYPMLFTRYPTTQEGSIYPGTTYMVSTLPSVSLTELDQGWNKTETIAPNFPIYGESFLNSMAPHHSHLSTLGADFDGDQGSSQSLYTEESIKEIKEYLDSKEAYISASGQILYSASTDIAEYTLAYMTTGA